MSLGHGWIIFWGGLQIVAFLVIGVLAIIALVLLIRFLRAQEKRNAQGFQPHQKCTHESHGQ